MTIRWLTKKDHDACGIIDGDWTSVDFEQQGKRSNVVGVVVEAADESVAGFAVYQSLSRHLELLRLAVSPLHRRRGVGSLMMRRLVAKLGDQKTCILADVPERSLDLQLFLKQQHFRCIGHGEELDTYRFEYLLTV